LERTWQDYNEANFRTMGYYYPPPYAREIWRTITGVHTSSRYLLTRILLQFIGIGFTLVVMFGWLASHDLEVALLSQNLQAQYWLWGAPVVGMALGAGAAQFGPLYYRIKYRVAFRNDPGLLRNWMNGWYLSACEYTVPIGAMLCYGISRLIVS